MWTARSPCSGMLSMFSESMPTSTAPAPARCSAAAAVNGVELGEAVQRQLGEVDAVRVRWNGRSTYVPVFEQMVTRPIYSVPVA